MVAPIINIMNITDIISSKVFLLISLALIIKSPGGGDEKRNGEIAQNPIKSSLPQEAQSLLTLFFFLLKLLKSPSEYRSYGVVHFQYVLDRFPGSSSLIAPVF